MKKILILLSTLCFATFAFSQNGTFRNLKATGSFQFTPSAGAGKVLTSNAVGRASWANVTSLGGWQITGNAGTVDSNFLGTTDAKTLRLGANDIKRFGIDTGGAVFIMPRYLEDTLRTYGFFGLSDFIVSNYDTTTTFQYLVRAGYSLLGSEFLRFSSTVNSFGYAADYGSSSLGSIHYIQRSDGIKFQNGVYMGDSADVNTGNVEFSVYSDDDNSDIGSFQIFCQSDSNAFIVTALYDKTNLLRKGEIRERYSAGRWTNQLLEIDDYTIYNDSMTVSMTNDFALTSTTGAFLPPRMTAVQGSALTPVDGMIIYVTTTNGTFLTIGFWGYENGAWVDL